jgi:hypothetical protein
MESYPRLTRSQLLARLRAHAARHGCVTNASLHAYDPDALRSIPLHFVGIAAAREAAVVPGAPYVKPRRKTGPKPGSVKATRRSAWSRARVIEDLRRLHREGQRLALHDLERNGHGALIHAAAIHTGGLRRARQLAGVDTPPRRRSKRWWNEKRIVQAIKKRARGSQPLASTQAPAALVTAGRWHFGSWSAALAAAGVDALAVKLPHPHKYTKDELLARLRRAARDGSDLGALSLAKIIDLKAVRREFGRLRAALVAAGLQDRLAQRRHGLQRWSRERVIEVLQERAREHLYTLTPALHRVAQLYFGGADYARRAAGVPSPQDIRAEERRDRVLGRSDRVDRRRPNRRGRGNGGP